METIANNETLNVESNLLAEVKAVYQTKQKSSELPKITSSKNGADYLHSIWNQNTIEYTEDFMVLYLNKANKVLGWTRISSGGIAGTVCDPKVIFSLALQTGASSLIIAHNHPSGNRNPSQADINSSKKIKEGGKLLDIELLDHIILTSESYYSFSDEGII